MDTQAAVIHPTSLFNVVERVGCWRPSNYSRTYGSYVSPSDIPVHTHTKVILIKNKGLLNHDTRPDLNNKRSKDLGALLDSCSWDDIGNFLQTCIKNSLVQTKSIEIWVTLTKYLTIHVSILDHIQHLNFDLSGSLKSNVSATGLPIYGFPLMFNSNGLTLLLYEI